MQVFAPVLEGALVSDKQDDGNFYSNTHNSAFLQVQFVCLCVPQLYSVTILWFFVFPSYW